jgi:transcriptional regulator with XRE-family HTH domain
MSRFHQRLHEDLKDPEFAEAFYDMSVDIALLQVLEQARKALNISEKELAKRMGVQRTTVTRLFNASHPNPTLDTISNILRALGLQAEVKISPASSQEVTIPIKARFVPSQTSDTP